jgi:hypothetical protein
MKTITRASSKRFSRAGSLLQWIGVRFLLFGPLPCIGHCAETGLNLIDDLTTTRLTAEKPDNGGQIV